MTEVQTQIAVTVRFFAAACAAAGREDEVLVVAPGATIRGVIAALSARSEELARVLARCSYLCDGFAVRDIDVALVTGQTLDVLPPFAGG